jgi:hypothetical protein
MVVFWYVTPCSLVDVDRRVRGASVIRVSPEDSLLHIRRHENLSLT